MTAPQESANEAHRRAWQDRLLPLMAAFLVAVALFFAALSVYELRDFYGRVAQTPLDLAASFEAYERANPVSAGDPAHLRFKTLALLEADALQRRYRQANSTMLARVWTRQLGFATGMLLALVGAAFVLGRLQEPPTRLSGEAQGAKAALESSSPGLVLAVLGTLLMGLALWIPFGVETRDVATYLKPSAAETPAPRPDPLARELELFGPALGVPPPAPPRDDP